MDILNALQQDVDEKVSTLAPEIIVRLLLKLSKGGKDCGRTECYKHGRLLLDYTEAAKVLHRAKKEDRHSFSFSNMLPLQPGVKSTWLSFNEANEKYKELKRRYHEASCDCILSI